MPGTMAYRQARLAFANEHTVWAKYYVRPGEQQSLAKYAASGWQYSGGGGGGGGGAATKRRKTYGRFSVSPYRSNRKTPNFSRSSIWYQMLNSIGKG